MKKLLSAVLICAMLTCAVPSVLVNSVSAVSLTLKESSHLVLDSSTGYIDKIDGTITADELKREFETPVRITGGDGSAKEGDTPVASDDTVTLESGSENIKVLIYGDLNRDGLIDMSDAIALMKQLAGWNEDICSAAANIDAENQDIDTDDAVKLLKYIAGWEVSPGNVRMTAANEKLTAANEDSDIELYFTSTMNKIGRSNTKSTGQYTYKMTLAGNETESCQMLISTKADKEGLSLELSEFEYEFGGATLTGSLNWEYYYNLALFNQLKPVDYDNYVKDYFPEALPPMADSFELTADRSQGIMISVTTEKDAPSGMYRATLNLKNSDGQVVKTAYVYAYVYDFSLPDTPYSTSAFNISKNDLMSKKNGVWNDPEASYALYCEYYEFLLNHNLSAYNIPYHVVDPRADQYMDDPRVTSFVIAGMDVAYGGEMYRTDDEVVAGYNKVKDNETWFNKGYFYYTDEACSGGLVTVKNAYEHLVSLLGTTNFRNMTPQACNIHPVDNAAMVEWIDPVEYIKDYINIWCPQAHAYHDWETGGKWSNRRSIEKYGNYSERAKAFRERGDSIWWYVCADPQMPYANFFNYYQGACIRVFLWQQFMNNVDGLLYYSTTDSWGNISKYKYDPVDGGDGLLLYWGELYGFEGPVASWRLLQIRDGFDDYDYLRIAEGLYGREAVMEVVNSVTTDMLEYSEDYHDIESAKEVLARMIEDAT